MISKDQTVIILIWKLVFDTNKKDERKKWLHELTLNSEFFENIKVTLKETFSLPQILFTFLIDIRFEMNRKCVMSKFRIGIELNSLIKALTLDIVQTRLLHEVLRPELRCNWIISTLLMSFVCNIQLFQHFLPLSYNFVRESLNLKDSPGVEIMLLFVHIYFRSAIFVKKIFPPRFIAWTSITYSTH